MVVLYDEFLKYKFLYIRFALQEMPYIYSISFSLADENLGYLDKLDVFFVYHSYLFVQ